MESCFERLSLKNTSDISKRELSDSDSFTRECVFVESCLQMNRLTYRLFYKQNVINKYLRELIYRVVIGLVYSKLLERESLNNPMVKNGYRKHTRNMHIVALIAK